MKNLLYALLFLLSAFSATAQHTRQDTLRGSNGRGRDWWDVQRYALEIEIDTTTKSIRGSNTITFRITGEPDIMQIDLQEGMILDSATIWDFSNDAIIDSKADLTLKDGNVYWVNFPFRNLRKEHSHSLTVSFHGKPKIAANAPWDGGFIWGKDSVGKPWIAVACQGLGASSWWPCKDYQGDEPDSGMKLVISKIPKDLQVISNGFEWMGYINEDGRPVNGGGEPRDPSIKTSTTWEIGNPINTYNTTFYIGDYAHWHDTLRGEKGILDLDFYPLKYNEAKARQHWAVTKEMLRCFEYWMGPYPFYEDGYKLVEAPFLGMEHQSAIAYGNEYKMGYRGTDRSKTGVGLAFDYIIIHETGHEWFGNNITARDVADNWLHEGFTSYAESLFAEWIKGRDSAFAYTTGKWALIKNDRPVIGDYGVHNDGSGDRYEKGAAIVHMVRMMVRDDSTFRRLLRGLNKDFYHKIVTTAEIENYINDYVGPDLKPFFDQYLRTTQVPTLKWKMDRKNNLRLHWENAVPGFCAPVIISQDGKDIRIIYPNVQNGLDYVIKEFTRKNLTIKAAGLYKVEKKR